MQQAQGRRISRFPGNTLIPSDAQFDFISGGVNYRISYTDLLPLLGATGVLDQVGDPLGAPVLDPAGTLYHIRNLEAGPGIIPLISPMNGITLKHNFTVDAVGVPLMALPAALSPIFRSIIAGPGINVADAGNQIQISTSGIPVSTRTVIVNQISDFPAPVGNVITLVPDTQYFIYNSIAMGTTRIVMTNNTSIEGADSSVVEMTFAGPGFMFTAVDANIRFGRIRLTSTTELLSFTNAALDKNIQFIDMTMTGLILGVINGCRALLLNNCATTFTGGVGFNITGSVGAFIASFLTGFTAANGPVFAIATAPAIPVFIASTCLVNLTVPGSIFIVGNNDVNITDISTVFGCRIFNPGGGTPLLNVSPDNARWQFLSNDLIRDTLPGAVTQLINNGAPTVIAAINTPVLITGAWVQATASQFTTTAAGRITYTGISGVTANITIDATLLAAAGPVNTFTVYLRVNGVMKAQQQITCDATDPQMISVSWRHTFITGEFVEAWIENNDDADDVIVRFATFLVG